jgi:hypothetical protein
MDGSASNHWTAYIPLQMIEKAPFTDRLLVYRESDEIIPFTLITARRMLGNENSLRGNFSAAG